MTNLSRETCCNKCLSPAVAYEICPSCGRIYQCCGDCGGAAAAERSLDAHRALLHAAEDRQPKQEQRARRVARRRRS